MEKFFQYMWDDRKNLLILCSLALLCLSMGYGLGYISTVRFKPKETIIHDTVCIDKPVQLGGTLESNNKIIVEEKPVKPLPALTKFKVTDWVCAWGKWSGVVREIHWSERNPNVLVYEVQHYNEIDNEWYENPYYDTELEAGKCN
jgi:hypothetical protein